MLTKSIALRAGNAATCTSCGANLDPKRGSRRQRFCSDACRQSAFRAKKWVEQYGIPEALRSVQNNSVVSRPCKGDFVDRPSPLNILGGYRWHDSVPVDRAVLTKIICAELGP